MTTFWNRFLPVYKINEKYNKRTLYASKSSFIVLACTMAENYSAI